MELSNEERERRQQAKYKAMLNRVQLGSKMSPPVDKVEQRLYQELVYMELMKTREDNIDDEIDRECEEVMRKMELRALSKDSDKGLDSAITLMFIGAIAITIACLGGILLLAIKLASLWL